VKLFISILAAATIIGGLVGGEITNRTFSLFGAVIGGGGLAIVLLSLGAYFEAQERKRNDEVLPQAVRAVFDRMTGRAPSSYTRGVKPKAPPKAAGPATSPPRLTIDGAIRELIAEDEAAAARGEVLPRRLIPHHAIKRDVVIAAYRKDFEAALSQLRTLQWTGAEKDRRSSEMTKDFEKHIAGVNRLGPEDLDNVIDLMRRTRTDLPQIEQIVRANNPVYDIVEPLAPVAMASSPLPPTRPNDDDPHQFVRYRTAVLWEQLPQWVDLSGFELMKWGNPNPDQLPPIPPAEFIHAHWRSFCYAYVYALVCVAEFKKDRHYLGSPRQKKLGSAVAELMVEDMAAALVPQPTDPVRLKAVAARELYEGLSATGAFAQAIATGQQAPDTVLFDYLAAKIGVAGEPRVHFDEQLRDFTKETFQALA
jgi:hypothetical protein